MPRSKAHLALLLALVALAAFALGLLASPRAPSSSPPRAPEAAPHDAGPAGAGPADAAAPRILLDPDSIQLLPDASLRLDLPQGFGGAAPAPR
ncbi:MAG: hypothetical protein IT372_02345 [Polyangiaceae bacterium]|nr:hypothetical protein [Polyangiaceae bacterium]